MPYKLSDTPKAIDFHFIKSPHFRVIHADGVWGGATPSNNIAISIFSERLPIPTVVKHHVQDDNQLGEEIKSERNTRTGIVREVETELIMNKATATALVDWLKSYIAQLP